MYQSPWQDVRSQFKDDRKTRPIWLLHLSGLGGGAAVLSLMLSPSDADSQAVFWGKGEDNTVQSHPVITSRSQGFPHPTSCGQWPCGSDFQEIRKKRERGIAFSEPGSVSSYAFSNSLIRHDIEGFKVGH